MSYHFVFRLFEPIGGDVIYLKNVQIAKGIAEHLFPEYTVKPIDNFGNSKSAVVDTSVYADRVYRTIFSIKVS